MLKKKCEGLKVADKRKSEKKINEPCPFKRSQGGGV